MVMMRWNKKTEYMYNAACSHVELFLLVAGDVIFDCRVAYVHPRSIKSMDKH